MFEWLDYDHKIRLFGVLLGFILLASSAFATVGTLSQTWNITDEGSLTLKVGVRTHIAYNFTAGATGSISNVTFRGKKTAGAGCTFNVSIQTDNAGHPSGTYYCSADYDGSTLGAALGNATINLSGCTNVTGGTSYWVVFDRESACDASNYVDIGVDRYNTYSNNSKVSVANGGAYSYFSPARYGIYEIFYPAVAPAIWNYTVLSSTYSSPVYEANNATFNFTIATNTSQITNVLANMSWNGTIYNPTSSGNSTTGDNNTYWFYYGDFTIPLVETNNTNVSQFWTYNITWTNTTQTNHSDTTNNQSIAYHYYWDAITADSTVLVGDNFSTEFNGTVNYGAGATLVYWTDFNGTTATRTPTVSADAWSEDYYFIAPNITADNVTLPLNGTFNVTFTGTHGGARTYERTSYDNVTIHRPSLVNCSGGVSSTVSIRFLFRNEVNVTTNVTSDMDLTVWTSGSPTLSPNYTANFSFSNVTQADLCLYPSWSTMYVDSFQVYTDAGSTYRDRNYFLTNATITNSTNTITLYNIQTTLSDLLTLTVVDDLVAQEGDYVTMERYYPGENLYRSVEVGLTDEDGQTFLYPVPNDVYYRFIVVRNYSTVYSGEPREIGVSSFTIDTGEGLSLEYFDYDEGVSVACNRTGNIIGCSLVNPSGLSVGAELLVKEIGIYTDTEICYSTVSTVSTSTLQCNITGYSGIIQADLMFIAPESLIHAWTGTYNGSGTNSFGDLGLLIGVLIIVGSALLLAYSPALTIVGALLGLIISVITGIVAISVTSVVLIAVAGAFLIMKMRT